MITWVTSPLDAFQAGAAQVGLTEFCVPSFQHGATHTMGVQRVFSK